MSDGWAGAVTAWLDHNWFSVIQSAGIISSLLLTTLMLLRDRRTRRIGDVLTLAQHHRDLWGDMHRRPELSRVTSSDPDLLACPITTAEEEYLHLVIMHFCTGFLLAREGSLITLSTLAVDAGSFLSLPLPRVVWEQTRHLRDPDFVCFVERALEKEGAKK